MKPFPLIQTDQPIDSLAYLDLGDAYGFMANSMSDMTKSTSRIMLYNLPYLQRVTLLGFKSVNRYVCAGEEEAFLVMVRNDGSLSISSFSLAIAIGDETYTIELDLTDLERTTPLPSVYDAAPAEAAVAASDGIAASNSQVTGSAFDVATKAGLLNPGVTRTFQFTWKVPENLSGETDVTVTVVEDGASDGSQGTNNVAQGEAARFRSGACFASSRNSDIVASQLVTSALFREPLAVAEQDDGGDTPSSPGSDSNPDDPTPPSGDSSDSSQDPTPPSGGSTSPSENSGEKDSGGSDHLANTGDNLSSTATAVLLAGLGLAGMGAAGLGMGTADFKGPR